MTASHMIRMPDLSALDIPRKQRCIFLKDDVIFSDIRNAHRSLAKQDLPADKGDYVLAKTVGKNGQEKTIHIELGSRCFPAYEDALLGCKAGETRHAAIYGEEITFHVETVKKVVEMPLTDQSIAALEIPDIQTLTDYRRQYIREHGAGKAGQIFNAIQGKLLNQIVELMEIFLDEGELNAFHQQQRSMIQKISGDVDERLLNAYGGSSPEEADRRFFEDNKLTFKIYIWGKALAQQNNRQMTEEEQQQMLENYAMIHEKTADEIAAEGLQDAVDQPFYIQYGIGQLKRYFMSLVSFSAVGIPAQSL